MNVFEVILEQILDGFILLIDLVKTFLSDLVTLVQILGHFLVSMPVIFGWMPSEIVTIVVVLMGVVVLYKVLGREG